MFKQIREYRRLRIDKPADWLKQPFLDFERNLSAWLYQGFRKIQQTNNNEEIELDRISRILFIRRNKLGDAIALLPLIQAIKSYRSRIHITVLGVSYNGPIFKRSPFVDEVIIVPERYMRNRYAVCFHPQMKKLRESKFDLVIAASGTYSSANAWLSYCVRAHIKIGVSSALGSVMDFVYTHPNHQSMIDLELHQVEKMASLLNLAARRELLACANLSEPVLTKKQSGKSTCEIALCPEVNRKQSRWADQSWIELASLLDSHGRTYHWIGSRPEGSDRKIVRPANVDDLINELENYDLIVCSEGGLSHLASALEKKIVVLSGVRIQKTWRPWTDKAIVLEKTDAINLITVDEVFKAIQSF